MNMIEFIGIAAVFGLSALGSGIGAGIAGQAAVGAWKRNYIQNKPASFLLIVFAVNFILLYRGLSKGIEAFCCWAMPALILFAVVVLSHVILAYTRFGRWVYAVGGNTKAAKYSGIRTKVVVLFIYAASGLLGSIAAVIMCSRYYSAKALYGQGIELTLITAALLGGVNIAGGEGTIVGALLGMLTIAVAQNGMIMIKVHSSYQGIVIAMLVLIVLIVNRFLARKRIAA